MVRRTKEESLETRRAIIAAAREVFLEHGVTRTSLEQIARAAGVTRGAIYWHFADKAELFYAMRDEVQIPLIDHTGSALESSQPDLDPLQRIERFLGLIVDRVFNDEATRKTFQILTFKCEYVGEFARDLASACTMHAELREKLARLYREAKRDGLLRPGLAPFSAASDTVIFLSGMFKISIVDDSGTLVRRHAARLVKDHIAAKRAPKRPVAVADAPARRARAPAKRPISRV